jgi:uncharacterized protein YegP (UPF0339 family)
LTPDKSGERLAAMAYQRKCKFEVYRDRAGEWRWRLRDTNGTIIADSGEGYSTRGGAEEGIRNVCDCCGNGEIVYV